MFTPEKNFCVFISYINLLAISPYTLQAILRRGSFMDCWGLRYFIDSLWSLYYAAWLFKTFFAGLKHASLLIRSDDVGIKKNEKKAGFRKIRSMMQIVFKTTEAKMFANGHSWAATPYFCHFLNVSTIDRITKLWSLSLYYLAVYFPAMHI